MRRPWSHPWRRLLLREQGASLTEHMALIAVIGLIVAGVALAAPGIGAALAAFERGLGVELPAECRRCLLEVGGGALDASCSTVTRRSACRPSRRSEAAWRPAAARSPIACRTASCLWPATEAATCCCSRWRGVSAARCGSGTTGSEAAEGEPATRDSLSRLAGSFRELRAGLRRNPVGEDAGVVISAWIDPAFLRQHGGR